MAPSIVRAICNLNDSVYLPIHATAKPNSFLGCTAERLILLRHNVSTRFLLIA